MTITQLIFTIVNFIKYKILQAKFACFFVDLFKCRLGHAVAQLVEALRYKQEGRGFDSRWCHWNYSLP
jgi:hypothetical protein